MVKCVLTLYGYTINVGPVDQNEHAVKVLACRKALSKLRVGHGRWMVPQTPTEQQFPAERDNWEKLLGGRDAFTHYFLI